MATERASVEELRALAEKVGMGVELYSEARKHWPHSGKHVLADATEEGVVVYQAFKPSIAEYAAENGKFVGCNGGEYSTTRMTWVKTNFLWMMYRAGWATKKNQEHILRITFSRAFFEEVLSTATKVTKKGTTPESVVRLQWDPDHQPLAPYTSTPRRAIQLGLKGKIAARLAAGVEGGDILAIDDITEFVTANRPTCEEDLETLLVPVERVYTVTGAAALEAVKPDKLAADFLSEADGPPPAPRGEGVGLGAGTAPGGTARRTARTERGDDEAKATADSEEA